MLPAALRTNGCVSSELLDFDTLELDASLSCPGKRDSTCAQWDHTVQLFVCCDHLSPYCNTELGRWITAFRRSDISVKPLEEHGEFPKESLQAIGKKLHFYILQYI